MNTSRAANSADRLIEAELNDDREDLSALINAARCIAEVTQEPGNYAALGELLVNADRLVEAEAAYRKSVDLPGGNFARHRDALSEVLERLGRLTDAITMSEQSIELDPGRPTRYLRLGQLLIRAGDYTQAKTILYRGLRLDQHSSALHSAISDAIQVVHSVDRKSFSITSVEYLVGGIILFFSCGPGMIISLFPELTNFQILSDNWILFNLKSRVIFGILFFVLFGFGILGILKGLRNMAPPGSLLDRMLSPWRWFSPR